MSLTDLKEGDSFRATAKVALPCPFCAGKFTIAETDDGDCVLHTIPICNQYEQLDALDYVTLARERYELLAATGYVLPKADA